MLRWEAAQIPKVKVAKPVRQKFNKEQTVYMPQIPDIAECPEHLLPLKQWEDLFLADFSELRKVCFANTRIYFLIGINKYYKMTAALLSLFLLYFNYFDPFVLFKVPS